MLAGTAGLILIPAAMTLCLSLSQWSLSSPPQWAGPANYLKLLWGAGQGPDPLFLQALANTLIIALVVPLQVGGSFLLAMLLSQRMGWAQTLRIIVFLPSLVSPVALYIIWRWVLNADFGLFENAFQWQRVGYGAAIGVAMFILALPLLLIVRVRKRPLGD
jgi:multiple sugar transport system permease protein